MRGSNYTLINPEIEILDGETVVRDEGCLSLPGLSERVPRVENIRLKWVDENFEPHEEVITGFLARSFSMSATILKECSISTISR